MKVFHGNDELMAAPNPHEAYVASWPRSTDWFCHRCDLPQGPNTNRVWLHDRRRCDETDGCKGYDGPLCPHCAEVIGA